MWERHKGKIVFTLIFLSMAAVLAYAMFQPLINWKRYAVPPVILVLKSEPENVDVTVNSMDERRELHIRENVLSNFHMVELHTGEVALIIGEDADPWQEPSYVENDLASRVELYLSGSYSSVPDLYAVSTSCDVRYPLFVQLKLRRANENEPNYIELPIVAGTDAFPVRVLRWTDNGFIDVGAHPKYHLPQE